MGLIPGQKDSLEKEMATIPGFFPGESHGLRSPAVYSPWGHKESDTTEQLGTHTQVHGLMLGTLLYLYFKRHS